MVGDNTTAIDIDGKERSLAEIAALCNITVRALYHRLNWCDGKWHVRPAQKGGRKPYKHLLVDKEAA